MVEEGVCLEEGGCGGGERLWRRGEAVVEALIEERCCGEGGPWRWDMVE